MTKRILILMAKEPTPGKVKTRLYPALSPHHAAQLYQSFLQDKIDQMREIRDVDRAIAYYPISARKSFEQLAPEFALIPQTGADLNARLIYIFETAFQQGYQQVAAIDSDSVTLPPAYLQQIFEYLDHSDVDLAIGPGEDGGYYAIGMKQLIPALFSVTMSTSRVLQDTLEEARKTRLSYRLTPLWYDIDTPDDLRRLAQELSEKDREQKLATTRCLRQFGWIV